MHFCIQTGLTSVGNTKYTQTVKEMANISEVLFVLQVMIRLENVMNVLL